MCKYRITHFSIFMEFVEIKGNSNILSSATALWKTATAMILQYYGCFDPIHLVFSRNASSLITGNQIYTRPSVFSILVQPSDGEVGIELPIQPRLIFLDEKVTSPIWLALHRMGCISKHPHIHSQSVCHMKLAAHRRPHCVGHSCKSHRVFLHCLWGFEISHRQNRDFWCVFPSQCWFCSWRKDSRLWWNLAFRLHGFGSAYCFSFWGHGGLNPEWCLWETSALP